MDWVSLILGGFAAIAAGFSVFFSLRASRHASAKRLALVEVEQADQRDLIESLTASVKKFRSREGMRRVREMRKENGAEPDPNTDPIAWKKFMRAKLGMTPVAKE